MPSKREGLRTLVVADGDLDSVPHIADGTPPHGTRIVRTPLDMIDCLDEHPERVVLAGIFAREGCFAELIHEMSPTTEVIVIGETAVA